MLLQISAWIIKKKNTTVYFIQWKQKSAEWNTKPSLESQSNLKLTVTLWFAVNLEQCVLPGLTHQQRKVWHSLCYVVRDT